jgi:hypothetical protein
MNFYKHLFFVLLIFSTVRFANAQSLSPEVISSNGDFYTNTGGSVSFTIGETVVETFNGASNILTQGFQQPFLVVTSIPEKENGNFLFLYPNPVKDNLMLDFNKMEGGNYQINVYDVSGKLVLDEKVEINSHFSTHSLSLLNLVNGFYIIGISDENKLNKSFKIIKQN